MHVCSFQPLHAVFADNSRCLYFLMQRNGCCGQKSTEFWSVIFNTMYVCYCTLFHLIDALTISDLYLVNVNLVDVTHPVMFGCALGLKQPTLERINSHYQQVERCFTEVLAAWLREEDRPHTLPGPNWGEVISALKSMNMTELADRLIENIPSKSHKE